MTTIVLKPLETAVRHASDIIHWVEGSGVAREDAGRAVTVELYSELDRATGTPANLGSSRKPGHLVLWRHANQAGERLLYMVKGEANESDRQRPVEDSYTVSGRVLDLAGIYNPRKFTLSSVGNFIDTADPTAKGHEVQLYRSPLGTRFGTFGGLEGNVRFASGIPASWSILTCTVTLRDSEGSVKFHAQADIYGDFRLAFAALPFPEREGDTFHTYSAKLSVNASAAASGVELADPAGFPTVLIKTTGADEIVEEIDLELTPGSIQRPTSHGADGSLLLTGS